jgi:hypothetical protein
LESDPISSVEGAAGALAALAHPAKPNAAITNSSDATWHILGPINRYVCGDSILSIPSELVSVHSVVAKQRLESPVQNETISKSVLLISMKRI